MEEDDIDIYEDLPSFETKDSQASKELSEKCSRFEKEIAELRGKLEKSEKSRNVLAGNLSSLMKTAKAEIARKDRMIAQLRQEVDNMAFRRGGHGAPKKQFTSRSVRKELDKNSDKEKPQAPPPKAKTSTDDGTTWSDFSDDEAANFGETYQPDKVTDTLFGERLRKRIKLEEEAEKAQKGKILTASLEKPAKTQEENIKKNGLVKKEKVSESNFNVSVKKEEIFEAPSKHEISVVPLIKEEIHDSERFPVRVSHSDGSKSQRRDEKNSSSREEHKAKLFEKTREALLKLAHGTGKSEEELSRRARSGSRGRNFRRDESRHNFDPSENCDNSRLPSKYAERDRGESSRRPEETRRGRHIREERSASSRSGSSDPRHDKQERNHADRSRDCREKRDNRRDDRRCREDDWNKCKKTTIDLRDRISSKDRNRHEDRDDQSSDRDHQRREHKSRSHEKSRSRSCGRSAEKESDRSKRSAEKESERSRRSAEKESERSRRSAEKESKKSRRSTRSTGKELERKSERSRSIERAIKAESTKEIDEEPRGRSKDTEVVGLETTKLDAEPKAFVGSSSDSAANDDGARISRETDKLTKPTGQDDEDGEPASSESITVEKLATEDETNELSIVLPENYSKETLKASSEPETELNLSSRSCREEEIENIEKFIKDYRENENPWLPMENGESTERDKSSDSTASIVDTLSMDIEEFPLEKKPENVFNENSRDTEDAAVEARVSRSPRTLVEEEKSRNEPEISEVSGIQSTTEKSLEISEVKADTGKSSEISEVKFDTEESSEISKVKSITEKSSGISEVKSSPEKSSEISKVKLDTEETSETSKVKSDTEETSEISKVKSGMEKSSEISKVKSSPEKSSEISKVKLGADETSKISKVKSGDEETPEVSDEKLGEDETSKMSKVKSGDEETSEVSEEKLGEDETSEVSEEKLGEDETSETSKVKPGANETSEVSEVKLGADETSRISKVKSDGEETSEVSEVKSVAHETPEGSKVKSDAEETSEVSEVGSGAENTAEDKVAAKQTKRRPRIPCLPIISRYSRNNPSILADCGTGSRVVASKPSKQNSAANESAKVKNVSTRRISEEKLGAQPTESITNNTDSQTAIDKQLEEDSNELIDKNSDTEIKNNPTDDDSHAREDTNNDGNGDKENEENPLSAAVSPEAEVATTKFNNVQVELRETRSTSKNIVAPVTSNDGKSFSRKRALPRDEENEPNLATKQCKIVVTVRRKRRIQLDDSSTSMTLVPSAHDEAHWKESSKAIPMS